MKKTNKIISCFLNAFSPSKSDRCNVFSVWWSDGKCVKTTILNFGLPEQFDLEIALPLSPLGHQGLSSNWPPGGHGLKKNLMRLF